MAARWTKYFTLLCIFLTSAFHAEGQDEVAVENGSPLPEDDIPIEFDPPFIEGLVVGTQITVTVRVNSTKTNVNNDLFIQVEVLDEEILQVVDNTSLVSLGYMNENCSYCGVFIVEGTFLGRTSLQFSYQFGEDELEEEEWTQLGGEKYPVSVIRPDRMVDRLFVGLVMTIVMLANVGMGCKVELEVVREVLRKPIPPIIGFCCQFLIMPLVSIRD